MSKRCVKRANVVRFFDIFLSKYSGTLKTKKSMKRFLEVARKKFSEEDLGLWLAQPLFSW